MQIRILPIADVLIATGLARRTLYDEINHGRFPRPVQLTARRVGWPANEVEDWISAKIAARDGKAA